jgi:enediyne biosynthesis protein E4
VFQLSDVSRGASFGDVDNDGDTDVLVTTNNGPVRLLINGIGHRRHWLGVRVVGSGLARDMIGARVAVTAAGGGTLWRRARSDGSYASANDPRVLFGLGDSTGPVGVRVIWPDGVVENWSSVTIDRWTTLEQGSGR